MASLGRRIADGQYTPSCPYPQLEAFEVTYDDCERPWYLCRCTDAQMSTDFAINEFGRLPGAFRSNIIQQFWISDKQADGSVGFYAGTAMATDLVDSSVFAGIGHDATTVIHETAHAMDRNFSITDFSATDTWKVAKAQDSCGPANDDNRESFAESVVMHMLIKNLSPLDPEWGNYSCMQNKLDLIEKYFAPQLTLSSHCNITRRVLQPRTNLIPIPGRDVPSPAFDNMTNSSSVPEPSSKPAMLRRGDNTGSETFTPTIDQVFF